MEQLQSLTQQNRHRPLREFLGWLRTNQYYAVKSPEREDRTSFVSVDEVTIYLQADNCQRLVDILEDIFEPDEPPDAAALVPDYVAVFCILVEIGEALAIDFLYKQDFNDHRLPVLYDPDRLPRGFPPNTDDGTFYRRFCEKQWRFCAPKFMRNMEKTFDNNLILPILEMKLAGEGSSAKLYEIRLSGPHNRLRTGIMLENPCEPSRNKFALKVFKARDAETCYKIEVEGFKRLRRANQEYLIAFYGCYTQLNTYNIILELADKGTLKQYFDREDPPSEREDILKFWKSMLNLLKGLDSIHNVPGSSGGKFLSGWHQDVNPSNILVVSNGATSPYDFIFKLADLGLSHFTSSRDGRITTDSDNFGTKVYGAPECYRHDSFWDHTDLQVKQHVDIWSLGCVYSEGAVWMGMTRQGLRRYQVERLSATKVISPRLGECFHDGNDVLPIVQRTHKLLEQKKVLRGCDQITMNIVKVVEDFMLVAADTRLDAKNLWLRSSKVVSASTTTQISPAYEDSGIDRQPSDSVRELRQPSQLPPTSVAPLRPQKAASDYPSSLNGNHIGNGLTLRQGQDLIDRSRYSSPDAPSICKNDGLGIFSRIDGNLLQQYQRLAERPTTPNQRHTIDTSFVSRRNISDNHIPGANNYEDEDYQARVAIDSSGNLHQQSSPAVRQDSRANTSRGSADQENGAGQQNPLRSSIASNPYSVRHVAEPDRRNGAGGHDLQHMDSEVLTPRPQPPNSAGSTSASSVDRPKKKKRLKNESNAKLPHLSLSVALLWKQEKKSWNRKKKIIPFYDKPPPKLLGERLLHKTHERDHVFIIDDALTMWPHWSEMCQLFGILAYIVKKSDEDGIDMYFAMDYKKHNSPDTKELIKTIEQRKSVLDGQSDINVRLQSLLGRYNQTLQHGHANRKEVQTHIKPISFYIFTDGIWDTASDPQPIIENTVKTMVDLNLPRNQVGIQFISFGNSEAGLKKLSHYDNDLGLKMDIVDHCKSGDGLWKMILGAIDPRFDDLSDDEDDTRKKSQE